MNSASPVQSRFAILLVGGSGGQAEPSSLSKALKTLKSEGIEVQSFDTVNEVTTAARETAKSLILYPIVSMEELSNVQRLLQGLERFLLSRTVRIIVVYSFGKESDAKSFQKIPIHEVLHASISEKALLIKLKRNMAILKGPESTDSSHSQAGSNVQMVGAMTEVADCWLYFMGRAKKERDHWIIQLKGPPDFFLRWEKSKSIPKTTPDEDYWEWVPSEKLLEMILMGRGSVAPGVTHLGQWVFRGEMPKYEDGFWLMIAKQPELSYYAAGKCRAQKLYGNGVGGPGLSVCYNSSQAIGLLAQIEEAVKKKGPNLQLKSGQDKVLETAISEPTASAGPLLTQNKFKPLVSILGLAVCTSEIMLKRTMDPGTVAFSFCGLLSKACWGQRVELWIFRNEKWSFFCNSDGGVSDFQEEFLKMGSLQRAQKASHHLYIEPVFSSKLQTGQAQENDSHLLLGAIAIRCQADQWDSVDFVNYFSQTGKIAIGIVLGVIGTIP